jgi:hypothetical protein
MQINTHIPKAGWTPAGVNLVFKLGMAYSFVLCQYQLLAVTGIVVAKFLLELVWPLVACIVHDKNGKVESALLDWTTAGALGEPLQPVGFAVLDAIEDSAEDLGLEHYWLVVYLLSPKDLRTQGQ